MDGATKTKINALKTASKKLICKAAEATGEFLGNKIANKIVKQKPVTDENSRNVEEIIIPPEKREEILNELRKILEHCKISKLLNDSSISNFVKRKWIKVNNLSSSQYSLNKNIRFKTSMLKSDLCDYSNAYIVGKGRISVTGINATNRRNKKRTFKNNTPFQS